MNASLHTCQYGPERRAALAKMQPRKSTGIIRRGLATVAIFALLVIALIATPPFTDGENDHYAQAKAEAKMKARLFTKYPDPLMVESDRLMFPVAYPKDEK